ncbi:MAG: phage holin family protein [Phycisphaeraceae bacterium]
MSRFTTRTERAEHDDRSLGELAGDLSAQANHLVQQEISLAKLEMRQIATRLMKDGALLIAGVAVAWLAVLALCGAIAAALTALFALAVDLAVAVWLGPLVTAVLLGIVATALIVVGRNRLKQEKVQPEQTKESLREDAQWLKRQFQ